MINVKKIKKVPGLYYIENFINNGSNIIKELDNNLYNSEPTFLFQTNSHVFRMDLKAVKQLHKQIGDIIFKNEKNNN